MENVKFSITIPAYKAKYLHEAIESCINQTYRNFELIVVDDASPEDLYSIVSEYSDDRIRYYRNYKNFGALNVVDNWNKCLSYATGNYIICMGDDDRLSTCCLSEYLKLVKKYPGTKVFHAWTEIIDETGRVTKKLDKRPEFESAIAFLHRRIVSGCRQFIGDFIFEVSSLRSVGGFYKLPLAWGSDDITSFRASCCKGIANTQHVCFQYRENSFSITLSGNIIEKLQAKVCEEEWYHGNFNTSLVKSIEDQKLFREIELKFPDYFDKEREKLSYEYLNGGLKNFISLFKSSSMLHLKKKRLFRLFVRTIKNKLL